jgi:hypothetical protein
MTRKKSFSDRNVEFLYQLYFLCRVFRVIRVQSTAILPFRPIHLTFAVVIEHETLDRCGRSEV